MRTIGNLVLLPLLAIFGFGFLLAHTLDISQDLTETKDQLLQMQESYQVLNGQYQTVVEEKNILTEKATELTDANAGLQARIEALEADRQKLTDQLEALQREQVAMEKNSLALSSLGIPSIKDAASFFGIPMVPLAFGAIYMLFRFKRSKQSGSPVQRDGQTTFQVLLTREELQLIARRRRFLQFQDRAK